LAVSSVRPDEEACFDIVAAWAGRINPVRVGWKRDTVPGWMKAAVRGAHINVLKS